MPAIPVQEEPQSLRTVCPAVHTLPDDLAGHILGRLVLGSRVQNYSQAAMDNHPVYRSADPGERVLVAGSYKGHIHRIDLDMTDCVEDIDAVGLGQGRHYSWSPEGARDTKGFVGRSRAY